VRSLPLKLLFLLLILAAGWLVFDELHTSRFQAGYFAKIAGKLNFELANGISPAIRFPKFGPSLNISTC
jgi:hypothetical protein